MKGDLGPTGNNNTAAVASPIRSGVSHPSVAAAVGLGPARKRNVAVAGMDSSPGSTDDVEETAEPQEEKKRQPVKRACNECRQQKVSTSTVPRSVARRADRRSSDAMSSRNPSPPAPAAAASSSNAKSNPTSSALGSAAEMLKWSGRSSS